MGPTWSWSWPEWSGNCNSTFILSSRLFCSGRGGIPSIACWCDIYTAHICTHTLAHTYTHGSSQCIPLVQWISNQFPEHQVTLATPTRRTHWLLQKSCHHGYSLLQTFFSANHHRTFLPHALFPVVLYLVYHHPQELTHIYWFFLCTIINKSGPYHFYHKTQTTACTTIC